MASWTQNQYVTVFTGYQPNDGTGFNIRDAFNTIDGNFGNISNFLLQPIVDLTSANIQLYLNTNYLTVSNSFTANATGTTSVFTGNSTAGNVISTGGVYAGSQSVFYGNIDVAGSIIPVGSGQYDLGSPSNPFRNLYYTVAVTGGAAQTTEAGLFLVHTHSNIGDIQDVGVYGNITNKYPSPTYSFVGYQHSTDNLIYKITNIDTSSGNSVITGGVYGNTQFGSQLLSNTTTSSSTTTGALIVAGGTGIAGDVNIGGNVNVTSNLVVTGNGFINGGQIITTNSPGLGTLYNAGSIFTTPVVVNVTTPSANVSTGALVVQGGVGVGGNINAGAFVGSVYGAIQTAAQPNITSLGTITNLNATSAAGTNLTYTYIYATSAVNTPSLTGLQVLSVAGNVSAGNIAATQFNGSLQGAVITTSQPYISSLGTVVATNFSTANARVTGGSMAGLTLQATNFSSPNVAITGGYIQGLANVSATTINGALATAVQSAVTTVGNLTSLAVSSGGITSVGNISSNTGLVAPAYYFANGSSHVSTSIGNTTEITANVAGGYNVGLSLTPTGVTAGNYGSATSIPTVVVDAKGRITSLTTNALVTAFTLNGTSGTASIGGGSTLSLAGTYGVTVAVGAEYANISTPQDLRTTASPTFSSVTANVTATSVTATNLTGTIQTANQPNITNIGTLSGNLNIAGSIIPTANITSNVGSVTSWFNTFFGVATHAQYADLAERYVADADYTPGTVVVFGGTEEITTTVQFADVRVAGAVSTDPAYLMNSLENGLPIALRGKIPLNVIGPVRKGDLLVTAGANPGYAVSVGTSTDYPLAVFAKSIETNVADGKKVIMAVII